MAMVFDPGTVGDAGKRLDRIEPLSWWTGMKTPLQLLVRGDGISLYDIRIEGGKGVLVKAVHKADSPNYCFVDVAVAEDAAPGTYWLVFDKDGESFKYPYEIAARTGTDGKPVPAGQLAGLHDFTSRLFQWRKGKKVIHDGKTMHFLSRDNTYGYFRYDDTDAVFVFINNSRGKKHVPWSHYSEIAAGLHDGRNVLTGEAVEVSDSTCVGPRQVLVVEYKR